VKVKIAVLKYRYSSFRVSMGRDYDYFHKGLFHA